MLRAAKDAIADGEPRLISVQPEDLLSELGVAPGEVRDGIRFARRFGFHTVACAPTADQPAFAEVDDRIEGYLLPTDAPGERYLVVATQGRGDEVALRAALGFPAAHVAFVGSRAKAASLKEELRATGVAEEDLERVKAPAGLDIGAVTPEEIALSIVAELVEVRRGGQRRVMREGLAEKERLGAGPEKDDALEAGPADAAARPGLLRRAGDRLREKMFSTMPDEKQRQEETSDLSLLLHRRFCCM